MQIDRRTLLGVVGGLGLATGLDPMSAFAADTTQTPAAKQPFGVRSLGKSTAPATVIEYFSLTCPHCAFFATRVLPKVVSVYVKTGKLYYIFKDFPLDAVALMAAQVARSLPPHEYYPFISALFASQDQWAFNSDLKTKKQYQDALFRYAALAGMDRASFDAAIANAKLRTFILNEQKRAETKYHVNATPSFIVDGRKHEGAMDFRQFSKMIKQA
ncbi:DsbA family protein [Acidiphilium iwatense]|uniref:DsbA family protein n=1 Tax=Acidiphilium iwatense TaxID=768198 RepID=A0ABS9DT14_9PROT|nr:DsbA family protein [Acidiphilium sp. AL]MCF3945868.1 DsbA family protein [Acidiphilium iwatense]